MGVRLVVGMVVGFGLVLALPVELHSVFPPFGIPVDFRPEPKAFVGNRLDPPEGHGFLTPPSGKRERTVPRIARFQSP